MGETTTTKSVWKNGSRDVTVTHHKDNGTSKSTHYKETLHPIFPNSVVKTGTSTTKKK